MCIGVVTIDSDCASAAMSHFLRMRMYDNDSPTPEPLQLYRFARLQRR